MSKEYFDRVADKWDDMRQEFFSDKIREKAYCIANLVKGTLAADIGAGTGYVTEGLTEKGVKVIAVDQSEEMLRQLKSRFGEKVDCRVGDASALPIENNVVDYVFANMFLHHVDSPSESITEMVRILKPGGKLIITDLDEHNFEFLRTEQFDRWLGFRREDIKVWLCHAGLHNVSVDCIGDNCCSTSESGTSQAKISIFVAHGDK
ncbi:class I SAM-dependent methyltransferase [Heliobacterium chlorum]|nr:class I SAM-dependent methyltransferase [Heliobacterium chlorum]